MLPGDFASRRRGSITVLGAVLALVLIALAGLAIDTAWVMSARQQLQRTADAAALAGAARIRGSGTAQPAARTAALNIALGNPVVGCCPNGVALDPNASNDPSGDVVVGKWRFDDAANDYVFDPTDPSPDAVQVRARCGAGTLNPAVPLFFGGLFGRGTVQGGRPATARLAPPDTPLVVVLDPSRSGALTIGGSVHLDVSGAAIQVDSNDPCAMTSNGAAATITASRVRVVGGACTGNGTVSGNVVTGSSYLPDPLVALPEPDTMGMPDHGSINAEGDYLPGYYPGGIDLNDGTARLAPGLYVLGSQAPGNGISMTGNALVDATSGVTLFLENGGSYSAAGNSAVHITAPSDGTYAGIGFFQARSNLSTFSADGNVDFDVEGTVYIPGAQFSLQGTPGRRFGRILARTVDLGGDSTVSVDGSLVPPTGARVPFLVQ
jgi:Flp pilus assembly protein TadG